MSSPLEWGMEEPVMQHSIVSGEEWLAARKALLKK